MADDDLEISTFVDEEGNKEVRVGDTVVEGGLSGRGRMERDRINAAADAPTEADVEGYLQRREYDPDWQVVVDRVEEVIAAGRADGRITEEEERAIRSNHRVCNEIYDATKSALVKEQLDGPRTNEISRLRQQLRTEDELTGGRRTNRRAEIELRLAGLMGGKR